MPLYEFRCKECGHEFERMQRVSAPNPSCPRKPQTDSIKEVGSEDVVDRVEGVSCGGETEKLISPSTFQLKGGGWEADGYA